MAFVKQWIDKYMSEATDTGNNRGTVGSGVFYAVGAEAVY
jgi:hypothetical protein